MLLTVVGLLFYVVLLWIGLTWKTPGSIEQQAITLLALALFFVLIRLVNRAYSYQKEP